jgi:hypothetical protein
LAIASDRRTGTRNRHRSIAARAIEEIALQVDQHQRRGTRVRTDVAIRSRRARLLAGRRPVTGSN